MKFVTGMLAGSLMLNVALGVWAWQAGSAANAVGISRVAAGDTRREAGIGAEMAAGRSESAREIPTPPATGWDHLRGSSFEDMVSRLRTAGFPPLAVRRIVTALVAERYDARRLELEKDLGPDPSGMGVALPQTDPKIGPEFRRLQQQQTEEVRRLLGGSLAELLADTADSQAMWRYQLGSIPPESFDRFYATWMEAVGERMQVMSRFRGQAPTEADQLKFAELDRQLRTKLAEMLPLEQVNDFMMRNGQTAAQIRDVLGIAKANEAEFRAAYPYLESFYEQFPPIWGNAPLSPERSAAKRVAEERLANQLKSMFGEARAAELLLATNPVDGGINRVLSRLDLPLSKAQEVAAVRDDMMKRVANVHREVSDPEARGPLLAALASEAATRVSETLGSRGMEAYKEYGGQWLMEIVPRAPGSGGSAGPR